MPRLPGALSRILTEVCDEEVPDRSGCAGSQHFLCRGVSSASCEACLQWRLCSGHCSSDKPNPSVCSSADDPTAEDGDPSRCRLWPAECSDLDSDAVCDSYSAALQGRLFRMYDRRMWSVVPIWTTERFVPVVPSPSPILWRDLMRFMLVLLTALTLAASAYAGPRRGWRSSTNVDSELASRGSVSWSVPETITYTDALDELNARRQVRGLRPYLRDETMTLAAARCALVRAHYRIRGHLLDEYSTPWTGGARSTGCAGNEVRHGFMACNDDATQYTYAGAAYVVGSDGRLYCHLFVR